VAQAYRPIAAKNRFSSWRRGIESGFSARSMDFPRLVEVVEALFQLDPAHERGQVLKRDG